MKTIEPIRNDVQYISSSKLCRYLESSGWLKKKEAAGISVWTYKKKDKSYGIFVPLNENFVDYQNRIHEVICTLEEVEEREKSKILESLQSASSLAAKTRREIIELQVKYEFEKKYDIATRKLGSVLKSLQELFQSLAEIEHVNLNNNELKNQIEVSLIETFQGSFGFRLAFSKVHSRQLSLLDSNAPVAEVVSQDFLELIKFSSVPHLLEEKISEYRGKPSVKFKTFVTNLLSLNAGLYLEWGSLNPEKGGVAEISYENLLQALEIISKREMIDPVIIKFTGRLVLAGIDKKKRKNTRFIAVNLDDSEKEYKGSISESVANNPKIELVVEKVYRMYLEQTSSVNSATGDEEIFYTLVNLEKLD